MMNPNDDEFQFLNILLFVHFSFLTIFPVLDPKHFITIASWCFNYISSTKTVFSGMY